MRFLDRHPSVLAVWRNGDREDNIEKEDGDGRLKLLRWLVPGLLCLSCVLMGIFVPVKFHLERLQERTKSTSQGEIYLHDNIYTTGN